MDDLEHAGNVAETIRSVVEQHGGSENLMPEEKDFDYLRPHLITLPSHRKVEDLTRAVRAAADAIKPRRRNGTAQMDTLGSLIEWAERNKGESSVLYAHCPATGETKPTLTCIANYHGTGAAAIDGKPDDTAQHCDHRAVYTFPVSREWQTWTEIEDKPLGKDDLGEFIEANIKDLIDPSPYLLSDGSKAKPEPWEERMAEIAAKLQGRFGQVQRLMQLSREFVVHEQSDLTMKTDRDTGEAIVTFVNQHKDAEGRPLKLPNLFLIAIPVFERGALYRLAVRFRYRKAGGKVVFHLSIFEPGRAFDDAVEESVTRAQEATSLPMFHGKPEQRI